MTYNLPDRNSVNELQNWPHSLAARANGSGMSKKKDSSFDFEKALADLEGLVNAMEEGDMSLEESLQSFEKGIKLTRECQTALKQAEQKVQLLLDENGETADFDSDDLED